MDNRNLLVLPGSGSIPVFQGEAVMDGDRSNGERRVEFRFDQDRVWEERLIRAFALIAAPGGPSLVNTGVGDGVQNSKKLQEAKE